MSRPATCKRITARGGCGVVSKQRRGTISTASSNRCVTTISGVSISSDNTLATATARSGDVEHVLAVAASITLTGNTVTDGTNITDWGTSRPATMTGITDVDVYEATTPTGTGNAESRTRGRTRRTVMAVVDPTGAGDSFAGGFMGYVARENNTEPATLRQAMLYGTAAASCCVEGFSSEFMSGPSTVEIEKRHAELLEMITP